VSGLSTKWGPVPVTLYLSAGPPPVLQFESQDLELEPGSGTGTGTGTAGLQLQPDQDLKLTPQNLFLAYMGVLIQHFFKKISKILNLFFIFYFIFLNRG